MFSESPDSLGDIAGDEQFADTPGIRPVGDLVVAALGSHQLSKSSAPATPSKSVMTYIFTVSPLPNRGLE